MFARVAAFARLARAEFLLGGIVAVALGSCVAAFERRTFDWQAYALAQFVLFAFHAMTHFANDYFDRHGDALSERTPYSGGSGILQRGLLPASAALGAACVLAAGGFAGIALMVATGRPLAALLAAAVAVLAWIYSAPPRLSASGLGELDTALVVAVLVPLCAFAAQTRTIDARALAATLPGALAMLAMMACVEVPDARVDAAAGKKNLVVRFGVARVAAAIPALLWALAAAVAAALAAGAPPSFALLEALAILPAVGLGRSSERVAAQAGGFLSGAPIPASFEALAARGVTLFFLVEFFGALGFGCGLPLRG